MRDPKTPLAVSSLLTNEDQISWGGGGRLCPPFPGALGERRLNHCLYLYSHFLGKMAPNFTILIKNSIHYPKFKFSK